MKIGGLLPFSLCDYPGRTSAVIFTQGCNFRCPFCHNGALISKNVSLDTLVAEAEVFRFLVTRHKQLDGVTVSGGEPTIQPELPRLLRQVKSMGFEVKLDTNGSCPDVLRRLLQDALVDFIAMDIKAPMPVYDRLTGVRAPVEKLKESIILIAQCGIPHEFRTTVVESLLSREDIESVRQMVPPRSPHRFQTFRPEHALDPILRKATYMHAQEKPTKDRKYEYSTG